MNGADLQFVLVHGGLGGAWVWEDVLPRLKWPAVAVDLPGHGSCPGELRSLTLAQCSQSVVAALPAVGKCILVGHSLGAGVVLRAAEACPDRIAHIVCVSGTVPRPGHSTVASFPAPMRWVFRAALWFGGDFAIGARLASLFLLNGVPEAKQNRVCRRLGRESKSLVLEPLQWSGKPSAPCTYVGCLRDRLIWPRVQTRMAANLGHAVSRATLDACHFAMIEQPEEVARTLDAIADRCGGKPLDNPVVSGTG
jgi:pimeloyl-ACP methyl ester carboxylesterase